MRTTTTNGSAMTDGSPQSAKGDPTAVADHVALMEELPLGVLIHRSGQIVYANREAARIVEAEDGGDLVGRSVIEFVVPEQKDAALERIRLVQEEGETTDLQQYEIRSDAGNLRVVEAMGMPVLFRGEPAVQLTVRDISELRRSEEHFLRLFELSPVPITVSTFEGSRFVEVNEAFVEFIGYDREELLGAAALELDVWVDPSDRNELARQIRESGRAVEVEARIRRKSGEIRHVLLFGERIELGGEDHLLALTHDITEWKELRRELEHQALYDSLTGLPNRTLFSDRLEHAVTRSRRSQRPVAVLYLDLDRFKVVNDTLGHPAGDALLEAVARRLEGALREEDTVARFGGDEFLVLLEEVEEAADVERAAERVVELFGEPFPVLETQVHVEASVGAAVASRDLEAADDLIRFSDVAMYQAKERRGTGYEMFDPTRDADATVRLHRENDLRRAVEEDEFTVRYQPLVSLSDGAVVGAEALVRWQHPDRGLLPPSEFIDLAEDTGLINGLDRSVLRTATGDLARWNEGRAGDPLLISVNLSAGQFQDPGLVELIRDVLDATGLSADRLQLELTENVAVKALGRVDRLREMGVGLALDDFGTGFSSLEYLRHLDVNALKLDRTFVAGIPARSTDQAIVRAIALMSHELGLGLVAEGVETRGQLDALLELQCDWAQGYLFSDALPADDFCALLDETGGRYPL